MDRDRWFADPWILTCIAVLLGLAFLGYGFALEDGTYGLPYSYWTGVFFVLLGLVVICVTAPAAFGFAFYYSWAKGHQPPRD